MSVSDTAVGAILEIPPQALKGIRDAEAALRSLHDASRNAAQQIYGDFGQRIPRALEQFVNKVKDAKGAVESIGEINVTFNATAATQSSQQFATQMQKTAADVSTAAQTMSTVWNEKLMGMKAPLGFDRIINDENESKISINSLIDAIEKLKAARDSYTDSQPRSNAMLGDLVLTRQQLTDLIVYLEKGVKQWQEFSGAKADALAKIQNKADTDAVKEYSRLLQDQIKYQKQLNELQSKISVREAKSGIGATPDELRQMSYLNAEIKKTETNLDAIRGKYSSLSEEARKAWDQSFIDAMLAKQREQINLTDKEREALDRIAKAREKADASAQKQTNKTYLDAEKRLLDNILDLRKQIAAAQNKVTVGTMTKSSTLEQDKKDLEILKNRIKDVKAEYLSLRQAQGTKLDATGQEQSRVNIEKYKNEIIKQTLKLREEENKALIRGNELSAQAQAQKARLGNTPEAAAQRQLNSDYKEMRNILQQIGDLRAKIASEGRTPTANEIALVGTLKERYRLFADDIKRVSGEYVTLSENARKMFEQDKSAIAKRNMIAYEDATRKAAAEAQKLADAKAKADEKAAESNQSRGLAQQNSLLTEQLRLRTQLNDLIIKKQTAEAAGGNLIPKDEQRITALVGRLATIQSELDKLSQASLKYSEVNRQAFDTRAQQAHIAMLGEESRATTKLESEMQRVALMMQNKARYPNLANAVFDTTAVEAKRQEFVNAIKSIEAEISKMGPKFQEAMTAKWNAKGIIDSMAVKDIQNLQQHINALGQSMIALSKAQGGGWHPNMQPVLDAINQLRGQISQIKQDSANMIDTSAEAQAVNQLLAAYDRLYEKIRNIQDEKGYYDKAKGAMDSVNAAIQQQIEKITQNESTIEKLNQAFVRLNATQKAYDASGNLTTQAKNIYDKIEALKEENRLLKQNATEAGKDNVTKVLERYRELQSKLERINTLMDDMKSATGISTASGTSAQAAQFNAYVGQKQAIEQEMRDIEMRNIKEVADYRQQVQQQQLQSNLSTFVQNEAQKKEAAVSAAKEAGRQYAQSFAGAMAQADKVLSGQSSGKLATNLENIKRVLNDLKAASGNLNLLNPADVQKAEQLKKKIAELENLLKKYKDAATPDKPVISPQDAINAARNATTLKQLEDAYKRLKEVMATTAQGSDWTKMNTQLRQTKTQIDDIKKKMGEFHNEVQRTSNVMGQLQNRIAAAFSVSAILGFAKKVTEVRAQFELQRVALGAIIQDRDEANKIFLQVQQMALESPFSIMQLERATKQVAAFGFEAKSLVPTMKMVADIGAGLGVELDRIVLVLGHMKARGYLEGTMVRQFTNMGFNVLGELAKYYSELEDRMVSVADVQERVKKKMVEFGDVEEVLKRVTSAGGMFYDMQKKQSDSIWGQMQRIKDAYDLMLNEIGQQNEGGIKTALTSIRELISSWRTLLPILKTVGVAFAFYFASVSWAPFLAGLAKATTGFRALRTMIWGARDAQLALNAAQKASAWGVVLAVLAAATMAVWELAAAQSKLNEEMERIGSSAVDNLNESIATFRMLADTISDVNSTFTERNDALTEMRRAYAEILPQEKMEIAYIQSLCGDYSELNRIIQDYYQNKEYQQKAEAVMGSDEAKKVKTQLQETLEQMNEDNMFDLKYSKSQISAWADTIAKEINTGKIPASLDSLEARIKEVFNAKDLSKYRAESYGDADLHDVMQEVEKVQKAWGEITLSTANAENAIKSYSESLSRMDMSQLESVRKNLQEQRDSLARDIEREYTQKDVYGNDSIYGVKIILSAEEIEEYKERLKTVDNQIKATEEAQSKWLANQFKVKVDELTNKLNGQVKAYWNLRNHMATLERQGQRNSDEWKKLAKDQEAAKESADKMAKEYGTKVNWALIESAQTSVDLRGELEKLASQAFPKVAQMAVKALDKVREYLLKSQKTLLTWLKNLGEVLPDNLKDKIPGAAKMFATVDNQLALTGEQLKALGDAIKGTESNADKTQDAIETLYSNQAKKRVEEAEADITKLNEIVFDADGHLKKGASDTAKDLRTAAKKWREDAEKYQTTTDKEFFLESNKLTEEQIKANVKNAEAAEKLASDLAGAENKKNKNSDRNTDKELKRWQDLKKAIEDVSTAYDKARKSFSVEESNRQIDKLFGKSFEELGFKMKDFYGDGAYGAESLIKAETILLGLTKDNTEERKKFRSELQRSMADTQMEIDVRTKEDSEKKLKADLDRLFDSYDLSKTLRDANIPINLVPMVGGEPIKDLDELRDRIQSQYEAEGGETAAEERVNAYKDALKKIDDMEAKSQQERLKNYQQYLAVMYSDRAKEMITSYTTMKNMERDFAGYRANLEKEAANPATSEARRQAIANEIKMLETQAKKAIDGVKNDMDQKLNQFEWNAFKGSPVFTQMYSDLQTLSKKGIDMLIIKLTAMRDKLQSMNDVDYRAVREMTQYIEKLNTQRIELDSWKELNSIIKQSYDLRKQGYDMDTAQKNLMDAQSDLDAATVEIDSLNMIVNLKRQEGEENDKTKNLTTEQLSLYNESEAVLQNMLKIATDNANAAQKNVGEWEGVVKTHKDAKAALERQLKSVESLKDSFDTIYDSALSVADALGADTEVWGDFAKGVGDSIFQVIILTIQLQIMGIAANSALGIIGYVAIALQVIANLLVAIFAAHDKSLQKQIEVQEEKVERLQRAYEKLKDSIDNAFKASSLKSDSRAAIQNLEEQKRATEEMIRLEEKKKKTDDDQIKQWREDIADINDQLAELKEDITEKWGGFGSQENYASAADEFASAWLDAFKETGDGLDALNEKWDEYIDNLIQQQVMLRIVGPRIEKFLKMVDKYVSSESDQGEYLTKNELDNLIRAKGELLEGLNEELKMYMDAMGWDQTGEFVLSDLQKGIQNITEPQAAAIEAYLNSMRFAVFRHTDQLDTLIQIVGAQYGVGADNPVVTELKGIRIVLDSIDRRLDSVIETKAGIGTILKIG